MTNNIEKLYELANITCKDLEFCESCIYLKNNQCINKKEFVEECLPFTAEKQLELIKWLADGLTLRINYNENSTLLMLMENAKTFLWASDDVFEEALAKLVCELWDDLTPEQREEVRGILQ